MKKFLFIAIASLFIGGIALADKKKCCKNKAKCQKEACAKKHEDATAGKSCANAQGQKACCKKKAGETGAVSQQGTEGMHACCKKNVAEGKKACCAKKHVEKDAE